MESSNNDLNSERTIGERIDIDKNALVKTNTYLDILLNGGIEKGIVTTLYGAPGTGKSNTCMAIAANIARENKKVIYIDTEGGFSATRIKDLISDISFLNNIFILKPITFEEQTQTLEKLSVQDLSSIGVLILDGVASLYRYERDKRPVHEVNPEFATQIQKLVVISRRNNIPVVITNQVYTDPVKNILKMVGGDIVPYRSKTIIHLIKNENERVAILKKHRYIKDGRCIKFKIEKQGLIPLGDIYFISQ